MSGRSLATTGTTTPILIPRQNGKPVRPGHDYFFIQLVSAQAVFSGSILNQISRLVVTSQVNLNHSALANQDLVAIQRSREVRRDRVEKLGLSPNLISLVPATMTHVSVSIDFILDRKNRLVLLAGLINEDSFLAAVSLAPGAAMIARTIGRLAQKVMTTFMPADERQPILQFKGDFNIDGAGLQEGYYAILATRDPTRPLPNPLPPLTVSNDELLVGDAPLDVSHVVLNVGRTEARGRERNDGAPWDPKLRQAEDLAMQVARDRSLGEDQRAREWESCKKLLIEARALLLSDANYTPEEADNIYWSTWERCESVLLARGGAERGGTEGGRLGQGWTPNLDSDRAFLGIPPPHQLEARLTDYADRVVRARQVLRQAQMD